MAFEYNCTGCGCDLYSEMIGTEPLTVCPSCGASLDNESVHTARRLARLKFIFGCGLGVAVLVCLVSQVFFDKLDWEKGLIFGGSAGLLVVFLFALVYFIKR